MKERERERERERESDDVNTKIKTIEPARSIELESWGQKAKHRLTRRRKYKSVVIRIKEQNT